MAVAPDPAPPSPATPGRVFDRTAAAILGTMLTLIVVLTVLLVSESTRNAADPPSTAQTAGSPHRA